MKTESSFGKNSDLPKDIGIEALVGDVVVVLATVDTVGVAVTDLVIVVMVAVADVGLVMVGMADVVLDIVDTVGMVVTDLVIVDMADVDMVFMDAVSMGERGVVMAVIVPMAFPAS